MSLLPAVYGKESKKAPCRHAKCRAKDGKRPQNGDPCHPRMGLIRASSYEAALQQHKVVQDETAYSTVSTEQAQDNLFRLQ